MKTTCFLAATFFGIATVVAQAQSVEEPVRGYLECAKSAIPLIDDRVSDASTIAIGLHAQCRTSFVDVGLGMERQNNLAEVLRPNLIQFVLLSRAAANRVRTPPKPANNKPNS